MDMYRTLAISYPKRTFMELWSFSLLGKVAITHLSQTYIHPLFFPSFSATDHVSSTGLGAKGLIRNTGGTSLVVQWLRIHLPIQGTRVRSLVQELRSHMPQCNWAPESQLLNPAHLELVLLNCTPTGEILHTAARTQCCQKLKLKNLVSMTIDT